ncbi:hypothetical protein HMPREF1141_2635 [Clostridium sp. MSTE9]|nr:hypothetical protein HMPREF1141_2635 [Clostridium sp. MSTE9]
MRPVFPIHPGLVPRCAGKIDKKSRHAISLFPAGGLFSSFALLYSRQKGKVNPSKAKRTFPSFCREKNRRFCSKKIRKQLLSISSKLALDFRSKTAFLLNPTSVWPVKK